MQRVDISEKERIDVESWRTNPYESPESDSIHNIINKMTDVPCLLECQAPFDSIFKKSTAVFELGGGQGWASCVLKRIYPQADFTVSDISEFAVASVHKWEKILSVTTEKPLACKSYDIPVPDASFDCVFTFSAAHHFGAHRKSLAEIHRVLKPGGSAFYFHEPACRPWIYKRAYLRVNRGRPDVPEDVIVYSKLIKIAEAVGFKAEFRFTPTLHKRGPKEYLYYTVLRAFPFLQHIFPCTGTFHFSKK